ncbi:hypothetical protein SK128_023497 [Halocaridina rubra]|uniref:SET domain-containing protein n=1 Tax=Halocaridina rubra TaxID=373956 RepID=A0AAN8X8R6_HALRR
METPIIDDLMLSFHSKIGQAKLLDLMKQFEPQKSYKELFEILWNTEEAHEHIKINLVVKKKSEDEAMRLIDAGDKCITEGNLNKALESYNSSLMVAPHPSVDFTSEICSNASENIQCNRGVGENYNSLYLAYAKRSMVLFELGHYQQCLRDISLARGCAQEQSALEQRRKQCLEKLENVNDSKYSTPTTISHEFCQNRSSIPKILSPNPTVPCLSSACKVAYTPEKGRHILADDNINPGDIIAIEKAYCTCLYNEHRANHCANCTRECVAPIPCSECTMAVFCSLNCRKEGLSGTHLLECPVLPTLYAMETMPFFGIAYKMLCGRTCNQWIKIINRLEKRSKEYILPEDRGKNEEGIYCSEDFETVYNLCTNVKDRPCGDLYAKTFIAFVLTKILELSRRFFVDEAKPVTPSKEDLIFAGQFIFANMMKFSSNGFSVADFKCSGPPYSLDHKDVGAGVYPTMSLLNHSCHPEAFPFSYGDWYVLRAARKIEKGEEITISYSNGSYLQPIDTRQQNLWDRYQFECCCKACEEEWPMYKDLPDTLRIKCTECSHPVSEIERKCPNCLLDFSDKNNDEKNLENISKWNVHIQEVKRANGDIQRIITDIQQHKSLKRQDLETICRAIEILEKYVPHPSKSLWDARDTLEFYFQRQKQNT